MEKEVVDPLILQRFNKTEVLVLAAALLLIIGGIMIVYTSVHNAIPQTSPSPASEQEVIRNQIQSELLEADQQLDSAVTLVSP